MNELHSPNSVLKELKKQNKESRVDFDPKNPKHRDDFMLLQSGKVALGKYNLRSLKYHQQGIYTDTFIMMKTELAIEHCTMFLKFRSQVSELNENI